VVPDNSRPSASAPPFDLVNLLADIASRLRSEVDLLVAGGRQHDPFRGLYITEVDVAEVVGSLARGDTGILDWPAIAADRLERLAVTFNLSEQELQLLLGAVLPDLDLRYERVFAYLQDDVTRKRPTVDLLLRMFWADPADRLRARELFNASAALRRNGLIQFDLDRQPDTSLLARTIRVDERLVAYLLGEDRLDERLGPSTYVLTKGGGPNDVAPTGLHGRLDAIARHIESRAPNSVVALEGPVGVGKTVAALELAARLDSSLLVVDIPALIGGDLAPHVAAQIVRREAALQGALLYLSAGAAMWDEGERVRAMREAFIDQHRYSRGPLLISGRSGFDMPAVLAGVPVIRVALQMPSNLERLGQWSAVLGGDLPPERLNEIAAAFRLSGGQIRDAASLARNRAALRQPPFDKLSDDDVYAGCRAVSGRGLASVADEVTNLASWPDLVLPADAMAQLRELCSTMACRATVLDRWGFGDKLSTGIGITALFAGPSGTGKTMAAGIVARELGLPLFRIDLARVVSKWIGETEKNLDRVFKAAEDSNGVLFLDEADALLGKRSEVRDSHDRYANLEISYLLQRMEVYDGLAILATNMRQLIDDAFTRRLSFTVLFPLPEEMDRRRIWRALWPAQLPREEDVDLDRLSRFRLPGGNIKNVLLAAAYMAAADGSGVRMQNLLHGIRREYQKLGKELTELELAE
jgi:AAA+ superfamily predicted ATPase